MPHREYDGAAPPPDPIPDEARVHLGSEGDRPGKPLHDPAGDGRDEAAPLRPWRERLARVLRLGGLAVFLGNAGGFAAVHAGHCPEYPYLPVALASYVVFLIGRGLGVRGRAATPAA